MNGNHRPHGFRAFALIACLAIVSAACAAAASPTPSPTASAAPTVAPATSTPTPKPLLTVKFYLPYLRSIAFWPVHLAEVLGYFKAEGLDIASQATDGSSFVVQQVAAGAAEFGIATADPVMLGYAASSNYQVVYDLLTGNVFDVWAVKGKGVNSLADLKNKVVGVKDLAGGDVPGVSIGLAKAGLHPGTDVKIQALGESAAIMADALAKGTIAAYSISWNSNIGIAAALKAQGLDLQCLTCGSSDAKGSEAVITSSKFILAHPDLVAGMGRALAKATLFGETNPDAAIAIMKTVNPDEQADPAFAKSYFAAALVITAPRPSGQFGDISTPAWNNEMQLILDPSVPSGLKAAVSLSALLNNTFLGQYNTFDQAAVKAAATAYKP